MRVTMPFGRPFDDLPFDEAQVAVAAFLARYQGRTLDAYRYDLRAFFQWAADDGIDILGATRPRSSATSGHGGPRPGGDHDRPARLDRLRLLPLRPHRRTHRRQPRSVCPPPQDRSPDARGLDRSELGALLFAAERFDAAHGALAVLLGLNGLRVSEACSTDIENLGFERRHRRLRIVGKGNKGGDPPRPPYGPHDRPRLRRADGGAILLRHDGQRLDRRTAHRSVRSIARRAGLGDVYPHMLRAAFIMCALDAGSPCGRSRSRPVTPVPGRPPYITTAARTSTSTRPTSSLRSWPEGEHCKSRSRLVS